MINHRMPATEIAQLSAQLQPLDLTARLTWLTQHFDNVVFSTSFGQEDQVITEVIGRNRLPIRVFTLDTGRLFYETYTLAEETRTRYLLAIETYFPAANDIEALVSKKGFFSFYDSVEERKECCRVRKIEPLKRALVGATVWVTGLRAEQSASRADVPLVAWDEQFQVLKVNPLIDWQYEQLTDYIRQNNIPENELHQRGFISIGCAPCTRAIQPGEDIRAGRWWWESSKKECGLHLAPNRV